MRGTSRSTWESGLRPDKARARELAERLCDAYYGDIGIHGETVGMSADRTRPQSTKAGSRDHLLFIALTSSGDFLVDADKHWESARKARESTTGDYLFDPREVVRRGYSRVAKDLKEWGIVEGFAEKKAKAWYRICETLSNKCQSDPNNLLTQGNYHAPTIIYALRNKTGGVPDYPLLRGRK